MCVGQQLEKFNNCTENALTMFTSDTKMHRNGSPIDVLSFTTDTFHTQVATYTGGNLLEWTEVESGNLPTPRWGLRAALVDNIIHVTGGYGHPNYFTSILAWNSTKESWQNVSDLAVGRYYHAAVAVPSSMIECWVSVVVLVYLDHLLIVVLSYIACQWFLQIVKAE